MSSDMYNKIKSILKIEEFDPEFIFYTGSLKNAKKWAKLITYLGKEANDNEETGYDTERLTTDPEFLCNAIFCILKEIGTNIPKDFPEQLDIDYNDMHYNDDESPFEIVMRNPIAKLIYNIFVSFTNINGFYIAYIDELINSNALDLEEIGIEIESCLINLAAAKINPDKKIAPHFKQFKQKVLQDYEEWLTFLKLKTIQAGIPLRAELMDMINLSSKEIGASAEAESLGLNKNHLHPDIYMNEILVSLRSIHQVLSYIMKKMKIYDEFKLDASDHYLDSPKE